MFPPLHFKSRLHSVFQNKSTTHCFNIHTATNRFQHQYFTQNCTTPAFNIFIRMSVPDFFEPVKVKKLFNSDKYFLRTMHRFLVLKYPIYRQHTFKQRL